MCITVIRHTQVYIFLNLHKCILMSRLYDYVSASQKVKTVFLLHFGKYVVLLWSFLPFFVFEVLEGQVYYFLDESIQKRMKRDLH